MTGGPAPAGGHCRLIARARSRRSCLATGPDDGPDWAVLLVMNVPRPRAHPASESGGADAPVR